MPDLLLEFFSEEIPARMQARAADDLRKVVTDRLVDAGLVYEGARAFATPRRLALAVHGVPARQPDVKEERKGPRVGAPEKAVEGFLKAAGLASIKDAKIESDPKKGDFYVALIERKGRPAIEVIGDIVPDVVRAFPWPKSMRWGEASQRNGSLNWVRPLHSILATFGPETEEPDIVTFEVDNVKAGDTTYGHRFLAPDAIKVKRLDDYVAKLEKAKVVLDPQRRKDIILAEAKNLAFAQGYELVEDQGLLDEVAGLVEWPLVLMGSFDEAFLKIPDEIIRATIRNNQKCFVLRDPAHAKLVNRFILVANTEASDGGAAIVAGNERVIRARLADAKFFYDTDLKTRLEERLPKFEHIVFHEKLGMQAERIARIMVLARHLAPLVGADVAKTERAAELCKADLLTEVVGEFPELQGLMGKYYAEAQGEDEAVAHACEDHYKPQGPNDLVPADPVSVAVALADKIDTLTAFRSIDEFPTGSRDPYGLRRAELGIVRLLEANDVNLDIRVIFESQYIDLAFQRMAWDEGFQTMLVEQFVSESDKNDENFLLHWEHGLGHKAVEQWASSTANESMLNLGERLIVLLRGRGARHDLVHAVVFVEIPKDIVSLIRRVESLGKFLDSDDGKNLLAGYKRATNIIRIEEKKDKREYTGAPDTKLYKQAEEKALAKAIDAARDEAGKAVAKEDFEAAMRAMAKLRPAVDAFFDKVTVNADDAKLRENRLKLLSEIRAATLTVADFSRIEG